MSSLIVKSDSPTAVKNLRTFEDDKQQKAKLADHELDVLKKRIAALEAALKRSEENAARQIKKTREAAIAETEARIETDHAQAVAALKAGAAQAIAAFTDRMREIDALALLVAESALDNLFDVPDRFKDLTREMIAQKTQKLLKMSIVSLRVSPDDFEDVTALQEAIRFEDEDAPVQAVLDPRMQAGECAYELSFGGVEISAADYWRQLKQRFETLASAEEDNN